MPIKFFKPVNPQEPIDMKKLEDAFNVFEYRDTDSIGKVYVTSYYVDAAPQILLWCYYKSKPEES